MLPIVGLPNADADLEDITDYIGQRNVEAAERLWHRLRSSVKLASSYPYMYRMSRRVQGTREILAHPNYRVLYRVAEQRIEVVNVVHVRREFPRS